MVVSICSCTPPFFRVRGRQYAKISRQLRRHPVPSVSIIIRAQLIVVPVQIRIKYHLHLYFFFLQNIQRTLQPGRFFRQRARYPLIRSKRWTCKCCKSLLWGKKTGGLIQPKAWIHQAKARTPSYRPYTTTNRCSADRQFHCRSRQA